MSYVQLCFRTHKAKKQHKCVWCGEPITIGSTYEYERSILDGEPQSNHWHPECSDEADECASGDSEFTFSPYENRRPIVGKAICESNEVF